MSPLAQTMTARELLEAAKQRAIDAARAKADEGSIQVRAVRNHRVATAEHPRDSECPVHGEVHHSNGWYWCEVVEDEDVEEPDTWSDLFQRALQAEGFAIHESTVGPSGLTGAQGCQGGPGKDALGRPGMVPTLG